jgi:hypothetical protein
VVAAILFQAWRRFPNRESRFALIGSVLILGGTLVSFAVVQIFLGQSLFPSDSGSRRQLIAVVAILRLPGLVGMLLLAYAYWLLVIGRRAIQPPHAGDGI